MIVKVHMLAYQPEYCIRDVQIPREAKTGLTLEEIHQIAGEVFHYGQNEFQPVRGVCSVSMGDVAEIDGKFIGYASVGYYELSHDEMTTYKNLDRRDRPFAAMWKRRNNKS